ncbi:unnamed protein product, partial [Closterium sp. NIES-53]
KRPEDGVWAPWWNTTATHAPWQSANVPHVLSLPSVLPSQVGRQGSAQRMGCVGSLVVYHHACYSSRQHAVSLSAPPNPTPFPSFRSWPAGKRPEDGVWAPWWYTTTHASTGFAPPALYPKPFPMEHYSLLEDCRPFYSLLHSKALVPLTTAADSSTTAPTTISPYPSVSPLPSPPLPVPANKQLLVWVGEEGLVPQRDAKIHVLDSAVQGGDAVWEGLRVYDGRIFKLLEHLDR